jgi:hypothetical protein
MEQNQKIAKKYKEFVLINGREPHSEFELCKTLKCDEKEFYSAFSSLESIRQYILVNHLKQVCDSLDADEEYSDFSAKDKALSLFFSIFEKLKEDRSYLLWKYGKLDSFQEKSKDWKQFLALLQERMDVLLQQAKASQEIKDRPYIGDHYAKGYKLAFTYLFRVWLKDDSIDFETTDAAIEKSIHLSFEMLASSPLDSLIDFGKFAFATKI